MGPEGNVIHGVKNRSFLWRHRVLIVGFGSLLVVHLAWYRFADAVVPEEQKPEIFKQLKKFDPFRRD